MYKKMLAATTAAFAVFAPAGAASADATTYTLVCGGTTYTVVKGDVNAASYTDGERIFVTAIGNFKTGGTAQPGAILCTLNGEGPIPFVVTPAH